MLSEVLNGVRNATGAVVEGATPDERVAVRLGPGDPRQVIAALLQGTPYDYVILGSQEGQEAVKRIVLTRPSESSSAQAPGGARPQPSVNSVPDRPPADEETTQPAGEIQTDQAEQPPQQPPQDQNRPKTPEQILRDQQQADGPKQ
jgi:hypothetical protein